MSKESFDDRLKKASNTLQNNSREIPAPSFKKMALSASTDMIAAIGIGFGLGLLLEKFTTISPWGMIVGFILGSIAGLLNVYRSLCRIGYGLGWHSFRQDKDQ